MKRALRQEDRSGLEVRRFRGVGWSVCSCRNGQIMDRLSTFITREEADQYAQALWDDVAPGIIAIEGHEPWLKLSHETGAA